MILIEYALTKSNLITMGIITLSNCRKPLSAGSDFFRFRQ